MVDIDQIKERYIGYDDVKIIELAKTGAKALRSEVVPLLVDEIKRRNLGVEIIDWIHAERRVLTDSELDNLKRKIKNCVCQECMRNRNLKGYQLTTRTGLVVTSHMSSRKLIVCEYCGRRKRKNSTIQSVLLGWISLIGLISYPFLIMEKIKHFYKEEELSDRLIEDLINNNIGTITLGHDTTEVLTELLRKHNTLKHSSIN